ncbi:MAG: hypothetical protein HKP57_03180, partial [Halobacteria archaeon]|nr:hypothetical protein [Halobacteria archaeon]
MKKIISISIAVLLLTGRPALATVVSTFDDTNLDCIGVNQDCWSVTPGDGTGFTLTNPGTGGNTGGNSDGYALLTDIVSGGSGGLAVAPVKFLGDLTGYDSISWDALLPSHWSPFNALKLVKLRISSNTTNYLYSPTGGTAGVWESWQAPLLDGPGWSRSGGGESLAEVLADVTELAFILEVTTFTGL